MIHDVLQEQADTGLELVTDGQVSWYDSQSHFARGLRGVGVGGLVRYFDTNTYYRQPVVEGPVSWERPILVDEWRYAHGASKVPVKAVLTGPVTLASLALDKHYGKKRLLATALAEALASEVEALVRAGARHVQIDEPILSDHPEDLPLVSDALGVLAGAKGRAELALFVYFGSVAKVYRRLLDLPADTLGLDLVQGEKTWDALRRNRTEKTLVLGLVDARNTRAEDPARLAARVRELRHSVDLERAYLSPSNGLEFLPREKAREKLSVVVRTARLVGGAA